MQMRRSKTPQQPAKKKGKTQNKALLLTLLLLLLPWHMEFIVLVLRHIEETDDAYVAGKLQSSNHGAGVRQRDESLLITPTL